MFDIREIAASEVPTRALAVKFMQLYERGRALEPGQALSIDGDAFRSAQALRNGFRVRGIDVKVVTRSEKLYIIKRG